MEKCMIHKVPSQFVENFSQFTPNQNPTEYRAHVFTAGRRGDCRHGLAGYDTRKIWLRITLTSLTENPSVTRTDWKSRGLSLRPRRARHIQISCSLRVDCKIFATRRRDFLFLKNPRRSTERPKTKFNKIKRSMYVRKVTRPRFALLWLTGHWTFFKRFLFKLKTYFYHITIRYWNYYFTFT